MIGFVCPGSQSDDASSPFPKRLHAIHAECDARELAGDRVGPFASSHTLSLSQIAIGFACSCACCSRTKPTVHINIDGRTDELGAGRGEEEETLTQSAASAPLKPQIYLLLCAKPGRESPLQRVQNYNTAYFCECLLFNAHTHTLNIHRHTLVSASKQARLQGVCAHSASCLVRTLMVLAYSWCLHIIVQAQATDPRVICCSVLCGKLLVSMCAAGV